MENYTEEQLPLAPKRPPFLQVIGILSFVGCGIMILVGLFGLKNLFHTPEEILSDQNFQMMKQMSEESYNAIAESLQYKNINAICGLLFPLLSLIGVIMMWNLKKTGFYIYVIAELLPYILSIALGGVKSIQAMGGMMPNMESLIYVVMGLMIAFDIAFIIMYAVNLKHMK